MGCCLFPRVCWLNFPCSALKRVNRMFSLAHVRKTTVLKMRSFTFLLFVAKTSRDVLAYCYSHSLLCFSSASDLAWFHLPFNALIPVPLLQPLLLSLAFGTHWNGLYIISNIWQRLQKANELRNQICLKSPALVPQEPVTMGDQWWADEITVQEETKREILGLGFSGDTRFDEKNQLNPHQKAQQKT